MEEYKVMLTKKEVRTLGENRYIRVRKLKILLPVIILVVALFGFNALANHYIENDWLVLLSISPIFITGFLYSWLFIRKASIEGEKFLKETQRQATD